MYLKDKIKEELKYVGMYYDFSEGCSEEVKFKIMSNGLVSLIEGSVILTDAGEKAIGLFVEEINEEEDITEAFFYEEGDEYECY